ncbi:MAG: hypothetical protein HN337_01570 [Deltaproteobacteria bacterium]|nr:hypothetical protein [Deltaproteobacteria bacterium]
MQRLLRSSIVLIVLATISACGGGAIRVSGSSATGGVTPLGTVLDVSDLDGATSVPVETTFRHIFDENVDHQTINTNSFFIAPTSSAGSSLSKAASDFALGDILASTVSISSDSNYTYYLDPADFLDEATLYTVCLTDNIDLSSGNPFSETCVTFMTESSVCLAKTDGDINCDGYPDLVVGAPLSEERKGKIDIYYGSSDGIGAFAGATFLGENDNESIGFTTAIGDVNGDKFEDIIVGAPYYEDDEIGTGGSDKVYIYFGSSDLSEKTTPDVTLSAYDGDTGFGNVIGSGDFNNDGYDDILIGAQDTSSTVYTGSAYLFYGSESISDSSTPHTTYSTSDYLGSAIAVGDFNGDGVDDAVIGAEDYPSTYGHPGRAYLYTGSTTGGLSKSPSLTFIGSSSGEHMGTDAASGDLNGDGYDDIIIGAEQYRLDENPSEWAGRCYVFFGGADVDATADFILQADSEQSLGSNVASGNLNGDEYQDLIVGALDYQDSRGAVYVIYGASSLSGETTNADLLLTGENIDDAFGEALATGDLNGDGYLETIIGAPGYNSYTGRVYVLDGSSDGLIQPPSLIIDSEISEVLLGASLGSTN